MAFTPEENIDNTPVVNELENSFLAYAMSVITSRALPDVRDGLKPVHRRILYSMEDQGLTPSSSFVKSARIVGDTMGRFHPHGDSAIYETMVRLAQDFSMGLPLVEGHGNFGTHSDPAAASRYTEARMSKAAMVMTDEIDEDTVDMRPNYDGKLLEPSVLPSGFPNLLVNGGEGIAVGMATKMPPHNLGEAVAACQHLLSHPGATVEDLMVHVPAPDFPTGGLVLDQGGVQDAYRTGRGAFRIRARTEIVGRDIVVTELPYQVGPERVIERIKALKDTGKLDEVASVIDLSDRNHGMRLVITAKRSSKGVPVNPEAVRKKLFKYTPLEESYSVHNLALVEGAPCTLTLLDMISHYVAHRIEVTRRRSEHRKKKAEARAHLLEGYLIALQAIEEVVALIRSSRDTESARTKLMKQFKLSEIQATSILEMPLRRLTNLEVKKITDELTELRKQIADLVRILADPAALRQLVADDLSANADPLVVPRRSTIVADGTADDDIDTESTEIPDVPVRIALTTAGKLGRFDQTPHKGARSKDDLLTAWIDCSVRDVIGVITNTGRLLHLHPIDVPVCEGRAKGGKAEEFIPDLSPAETIVGFTRIADDAPMLALATRNGFIKRFNLADAGKRSGQEVIGFKGDDELVGVTTLAGDPDTHDLILVTDTAQLLRFNAAGVRPQGRTGAGVAGIKLTGATVVAFGAVPNDGGDAVVVTLTDGGNLKYTAASDYPVKGRAGAGVRCMKLLAADTRVVAAAVAPLAQLSGVSPTGATAKLAGRPAKRDASGVPCDVSALAWQRP